MKFIDSDNSEFVSKELYYYVSKSLGYSWSYIARRLTLRLTLTSGYLLLVAFSIDALREVSGSYKSTYALFFASSVLVLVPEVARAACVVDDSRTHSDWSSRMSAILDEHVRSDRDACSHLEVERELTTYDVRPVGGIEYERPQLRVFGSLSTWRYAMSVSGERVGGECAPGGVRSAIVNKLAAAGFLVRVLNSLLPTIKDVGTVASWTEAIETSILEGAARSHEVTDPPTECQQWFTAEIGAEVRQLNCGTTIDTLTTTLNAALYGYERSTGALVTIGNTAFAVIWQQGSIIVFTAALRDELLGSCHGAILVKADFNVVSLQEAIKLVLNPANPGQVSVLNHEDIEVLLYTPSADSDNLEIV